MGIFDGPLFDFNGDGKTDAFEFAMAMSIIEDIEQEERQTTNQLEQKEKGDRAIPISVIVMCVLGSSLEDPAHCLFHPRLR